MQVFLIVFSWLFTIISVFSHLPTSVYGFSTPYLLGDVAINCGCLTNSTALDGRQWVGETPLLRTKGNSRSSTSAHKFLSADPTPYLTARISFSYFSYLFQVNPGQKFIRLHFYAEPYLGFENSQDFFTVQANSFTLLHNFSASIAAHALGVKYVVKEYCLNVNETGNLQITFFALQRSSKTGGTHAFINGIEIISMPNGLYYTPDEHLGARVVGQSNRFHYVDNNTALELVQRLNVGGGSISPVEDTGLFRRWTEDVDYLQESGFPQLNHFVPAIEYTIAPPKMYQTSRKLKKNLPIEDHFTWKIPVDLGFSYLLRLHFCYFGIEFPEGVVKDFNIIIQDLVAESKVNVIQLSGGNTIPVYRDYLVMMRGGRFEGKHDLFISLQSFDALVLGLLKGLEIFKLSNLENSLASPNPFCLKETSRFWTSKIQNILLAFGHLNLTVTALTVLLAILNCGVYQLRRSYESTLWQQGNVQSVPDEPSCRLFSLSEILLATQDFNEALVIGKGGFGKVYKGFIYGRPEIVAIKRLKPESKQGASEFWREIETLSKLRHMNLVSLLGYCMEREEMILVYEYMPRGTIADNLYKNSRNGKDGICLTWEQRLKICIGAARGLDYLHTSTQHGVIHRDVKDTNILLDANFVTKISDFGLSKLGKIDESHTQLSTKIKGTIGYLDPDYHRTHKASSKSDVYAFGIVMLVVVSGRPAVETRVFGETQNLLACFHKCMKKGEMKEIIDPCLLGHILTESLTRFMEVVENCVHRQPKKRPTMAQIVAHLEHALEEQIGAVPSDCCDDATFGQSSPAGSNRPFEFYELQVGPLPEERIVSLPGEGNNTGKGIQNADLQTRADILQSKGKDQNITQKPLWGRPWIALKNIRKPTKKTGLSLQSPRVFSLKDIKLATKNFSDKLIIELVGYDKVYKGVINAGSGIVAIKRFTSASAWAAEVELVSTARYIHIVPLVGFCNESNELIVVYEYMSRGTFDNYLYRNNGSGNGDISLTWEQRLRVCIGAARGLSYLHDVGFIHRDVQDHNIMLDENFVAKISNFGLSKLIGESDSHVSTCVRGYNRIGYMDPSYMGTGILTKATDVYSFGIVLLVVISGRPAFNINRPEKQMDIRSWYETCSEEGKFDELVDPKLVGGIPSASLIKFLELIKSCLHDDPELRPVMFQVLVNLEEAAQVCLDLQSPIKNLGLALQSPAKKVSLAWQSPRLFSLKEIKLATRYFSVDLIIGTGAFCNVYKGFINGLGTVAIKRFTSASLWGAKEFQAEVELLSTAHCIHLVSFVGFCNESNEMIVVYEYMSHGTLDNHLYRDNRYGKADISLTWEQRLRICIGAARGISYLHEVGVIHRNVQDHNIMLDGKFVAKISDFGLSKFVSLGESEIVCTRVIMGTGPNPDYMDPNYICSGRLTKASDVYSFGIVLLVILSGRPAFDDNHPEKQENIKSWYETCSQEGNFDELIDPKLVGGIPSESLIKFIELIKSCLHDDPKLRPAMAQAVVNLEEALQCNAVFDL